MKSLKPAFAALALACALPAHANLLVDGGFEQPAVSRGGFATMSSIPGWIGAPTIEVQNHVAGSPFEGNQYVELDTNANSSMYQDVSTIAGTTYSVHFAYSPRPGVAAMSNGIAAFWGDTLYAMVALNGVGLPDTAWTGYDFTTVATGSTSRLTFSAFGTSDSLGGYLDDVRLTAVPEPGTLQVFGLGLVILATIGGTRRRRAHDGSSIG